MTFYRLTVVDDEDVDRWSAASEGSNADNGDHPLLDVLGEHWKKLKQIFSSDQKSSTNSNPNPNVLKPIKDKKIKEKSELMKPSQVGQITDSGFMESCQLPIFTVVYFSQGG